MNKRGYIYQELNNWYENFNSLFLWVLITRYCRFLAVHNCIFLYIMLGTKPKLAAQWEIIPNKSPINSWWIHASSEKEEDELDWCTRWCFLHGHWRNQVGILVFSEDLRGGGFFWFVFLVGCCSADFVVRQGSLQQICCYKLYTGTTAGIKVGKSRDMPNHVWCAWSCTCIPEKADLLLPEQFLAEMGNKGRKAEAGSPPFQTHECLWRFHRRVSGTDAEGQTSCT